MRDAMRTTAVTALAMLAGCELVREPTPLEIAHEQIMVHGMLVAGEPRVALLITRFAPVQRDAPLELLPVIGASVHISSAGHTVTLHATGRWEDCLSQFGGAIGDTEVIGEGCYVATVNGGITPGAIYELNIELPNGGTVTGATEVPQPITVLAPAAGGAIEFVSDPLSPPPAALPLRWSHPGAAGALHLRLSVEDPTCYDAGLVEENERADRPVFGTVLDLSGRDSARVTGWFLSCPILGPGAEFAGSLHFTLYDVSYTQHVRISGATSKPRVDVASGLSGAVGVFGSAATTRLPVRVIYR